MDLFVRRRSEQFEEKFESPHNNIFQDRKWEWGFLRKQCRNLELEPFYKTYTQRLQRSYLSIFIILQAVIGIGHTTLLLSASNHGTDKFPEIFSYFGTILLVWVPLFITFREDLIKRHEWVAYLASFIAICSLVFADLIVPLYNATIYFPKPALRPTYGSYILYAIYIFIPLSDNWHSFFLGIAVTICYLIEFIFVTYRIDDNLLIKTLTEAIFLLFINFFGIYFRFMKEIAIRTTFLDRRACVEESLLLRYARDQEKSLLVSILPPNTAENLENDIRQRIEQIKLEKAREVKVSTPSNSTTTRRWIGLPEGKLHVEEHHDVSILYADIVNYTYMTTQLGVKDLVETLHELFVKFDRASEEHNVLRIKFLGDCYYGVSGAPVKNVYHGKSCVDLGLRMIKEIREVSYRRKLNIDMRIGVHSGSIISGIIGACKWQYDVWSKDVDIANRLEATGEAGKVHITEQTLGFLSDMYYEIKDGTQKAKDDVVLMKYNIKTYLVYPPRISSEVDMTRKSVGVRRMLESKSKGATPSITKNFMQNTIEQYNQIRAQTKLEMGSELDKMPIGKFHLMKLCFGSTQRLTQDELEEQNFRSNVSTIFLFFKNIRWEVLFLLEPDIMLKYSILVGFLTFLAIMSVQGINSPKGTRFWITNGIAGFILLIFIPFTWYKKLWLLFTRPNEDDNDDERSPKNRISYFLYHMSHRIMENIFTRILIYITITAILTTCSLFHLVHCTQEYNVNLNGTETGSDHEKKTHRLCFNSWAITESLVLTICMSYLFVRIPFLLKFIVGFIITLVYSWIVFDKFSFVFDNSPSTNLGLDPHYSHVYVIILTFLIFHVVDRQTEYIAKVDYNWKQQLQKKREDAKFTNDTVKILVENILPAHVADLYMSRSMKDEPYHEKYENVAIMFATITNMANSDIVGKEKTVLEILNGVICDFDEALMSYNGPLKIEKIKIAGWTYMAAVGLVPGRCSLTSSIGNRNSLNARSSAIILNGRRSGNQSDRLRRYSIDWLETETKVKVKKTERSTSCTKPAYDPVYVMTEFALKLMKVLEEYNSENFQSGILRVGISHGETMAGVVGSSKPLYDVWGNAVNMASRMDSTGIPGKIQVTKETALVLRRFGIKCDYRGLTFVKGRNYIPTYFVDIDDNNTFVRKQFTSDSTNSKEIIIDSTNL